MTNDTGWRKITRENGEILYRRDWLDSNGEIFKFSTVEVARPDDPALLQGWYFPTNSSAAFRTLAAAKRYATMHPYYKRYAL